MPRSLADLQGAINSLCAQFGLADLDLDFNPHDGTWIAAVYLPGGEDPVAAGSAERDLLIAVHRLAHELLLAKAEVDRCRAEIRAGGPVPLAA